MNEKTLIRRRPGWLVLAMFMMTAIFGAAQMTNAPGSLDFSAFKIITDRNIFDPNREPHTVAFHESRRTPPQNFFFLAGTMSYWKGRFAFFDGTSPDYRKILEPGGVIAGYKVTRITPGSVVMEAGGKPIEFKVGAQMRHHDDGTWEMIAAEGQLPDTSAEDSGESTTETNAPVNSSMDANEVLKRLMQLRQQEMK